MQDATLPGTLMDAYGFLTGPSDRKGYIAGEEYSHWYARLADGRVLTTFFFEGPWPTVAWEVPEGFIILRHGHGGFWLRPGPLARGGTPEAEFSMHYADGEVGWLSGPTFAPQGLGTLPVDVLWSRPKDGRPGFAYGVAETVPDASGVLRLTGEAGAGFSYDPFTRELRDGGGNVLLALPPNTYPELAQIVPEDH